MQFLANKRLLFSCVYLGLLFFVAGTLFYTVVGFKGTLFLQRGVTETLVFRPSEGRLALGAAQRNVPSDLLLLENPGVARVLRKDQNYDAMVLPFALRLDEVEVLAERPSKHWLEVEGPDVEKRVQIVAGGEVPLPAGSIQVDEIGPWEGLVRTGVGRPMATVRLENPEGASAKLLFLEDRQWQFPTQDLALCFYWHESEAALEAASAHGLAGLNAARWGVRDGKATQWLASFEQGAGLRLRDGTEVVLEADGRREGWVMLRVTKGAETETHRIHANRANPDEPFLLQDPAAAERVLELHAWREDQIVARILGPDGAETTELKPGMQWEVANVPTPLEPVQVMASAVPIPGGEVQAAYVHLGGEEVTLREGLMETAGDYRIRYQREPQPPEARYHFAAVQPDGQPHETFALDATTSARVGAWLFRLSEENPFAPAGIALDATRRPGGFAQYLGLGLFVAGSFGLVILRFAGRKNAE